ncbi:AbrB/MazE/SpoVT family DNA-binding domain-containing protein [Neobacillus sp. OS1-33]|uniref:AbrB/MazE/SpoVT family DNA-binding domain-containing protein n=1 Tax=Neobacillus sp. OS1-33 TaxID=3070683 RepID=UPI0027E188FA|nr:AbrB/MazE/SpoVT family DNA-binding domain-containing protein [Neobacillus sp. OS1-33]WML26409.1 AbrB/MazE/SpoVT family DNA-binding domain-containing protein [Neobacillus sp. OS1-33]
MKSTGMVRKVDELGRIVIPIELRRSLDLELKDPVEIFVDGEQIILKKYSPNMACMLTGEVTNENKKYGNGQIVLSPKGAEILLQELKKQIAVPS